MPSLNPEISSLKVSSTLNKNTKEFGKKYLTDNNPDTCWQSDKSENDTQSIQINFEEENPVKIKEFKINFQGGFAAKKIKIICQDSNSENSERIFNPVDSNKMQVFYFDELEGLSFKVILSECTDFYGRVIIYHLELVGESL